MLKDQPFAELFALRQALSEPNETSSHILEKNPSRRLTNLAGSHGFKQACSDAHTSLANTLEELPEESISPKPVSIYIPVLRGLRAIGYTPSDRNHADLFEERTREDYGLNSKALVLGTGAQLYHTIREMLLGTKEQRDTIRRYEGFLSSTFFEGQDVTLTPNDKKDVLLILVGADERPIHDVGDGLQAVIIQTFESFIRTDKPCFFFIEEPELFLHPGLERRLIEFFNRQTNHVFFLTTHSNHLLDMTLDYDMSVFNFRRTQDEPSPSFQVQSVNRGDRSSLELLGVRNSSVFLVNATIWVEGVTERHYFREYLRLYQETLDDVSQHVSEDVHYSFVEYGGSNITHWSFLDDEEAPIQVQNLCSKAFLIADSDGSEADGTDKKAKRLGHFENTLKERFAKTPGREIENLLPWTVIAEVITSYEASDAALPKAPRADYRDEKLGDFINKLLGKKKKRKASYAAASGTVSNKTAFCRKACDALLECKWSDIDPEVQELVVTIHNFVLTQNGSAQH